MKKIILSFITFVIIHAANAQFHVGVHGGIHLNNIKATEVAGGLTNNIYSNGIAGLVFEMQASKHFAVQPELNFTSFRAASTTGNAKICMQYVQVPVLLKYISNMGLNFFAGPQISFLTKARSENLQGDETDIKNNFTENDFSAVAGLEYVFEKGIFLNARYQHGFSDVYKVEAGSSFESKHRAAQVTVGYFFGHQRKNIHTVR